MKFELIALIPRHLTVKYATFYSINVLRNGHAVALTLWQ